MWSGIIAHTGAAAGPTVPATTATQSQSVNWQVPKGPSGALPASQTDTRPSPAPCRAPLCLLSSAKDFVTFPLPQTWQRWGVGEVRGSGGARAGQRNVPTGTLARSPTPPVRPRRRAGGPSPAGPQCTQRLSPGELSTAGKKSQRNEASPVARWRGHPLGPTAPAGAAAGVCGGWG